MVRSLPRREADELVTGRPVVRRVDVVRRHESDVLARREAGVDHVPTVRCRKTQAPAVGLEIATEGEAVEE